MDCAAVATVASIVILAVFTACGIAVKRLIDKAPEGFEDESGFHLGRRDGVIPNTGEEK